MVSEEPRTRAMSEEPRSRAMSVEPQVNYKLIEVSADQREMFRGYEELLIEVSL